MLGFKNQVIENYGIAWWCMFTFMNWFIIVSRIRRQPVFYKAYSRKSKW